MEVKVDGLAGGVAEAALASVTPGMVARMAELAERSATALDLLTHPDVLALLAQLQQSAPALTHALARVEQMHRSGALETLLTLAESVEGARQDAAVDGDTVGVFDLMRRLKEPELQFALKFMLAMARRLPATK